MDTIPNYGWAAVLTVLLGIVASLLARSAETRKERRNERARAKQAALDALAAGDPDGAVDSVLGMPERKP